jgi:methionine-rich copper-binding protein CopC
MTRPARLALILVAVAACSAPAAAGGDYLLSEGLIDGPSSLSGAGASTLHVSNVGEFTHTLVVTDDEGEVIAATDLVVPGAEATLEVDLQPGTYVFSCRIVSQDDEGNLIDHFESGMHRTVTVRG